MNKNLFIIGSLLFASSMLFSCSEENDGPDDSGKDDVRLTIDFEGTTLGSLGYNNQLRYSADGASFNNNYMAEYDSWDGFAFSCLGSDKYVSFNPDQYMVYSSTGEIKKDAGHDSDKFAIGYGSDYSGWPTITFDKSVKVKSLWLNNTAYVYNTVKDGNQFSKKFEKGDWFLLTIEGYAGSDDVEPVYSKEFYLADYRNEFQAYWYIVSDWTLCDAFVNSDATVKKLVFKMSSTDNGDYGMNTPSYFALDDLKFEVAE